MQFIYQPINAMMAFILFTAVTATPVSDTAKGAVAWADPENCHRFYECPAGGKPVLKTCGPGTAFQAKYSVCDFEHLVESCRRHK